ncbi:hypothetical protein CGK41_21145 [Vibrio parahaemolyticus]|nr:hypothetical protein CGK41_21145 [Vibrio parahaemolyticus]TOK89081.1 hypothetical protein CGI08_19660 [Vibrio parahaemolyticus]
MLLLLKSERLVIMANLFCISPFSKNFLSIVFTYQINIHHPLALMRSIIDNIFIETNTIE